MGLPYVKKRIVMQYNANMRVDTYYKESLIARDDFPTTVVAKQTTVSKSRNPKWIELNKAKRRLEVALRESPSPQRRRQLERVLKILKDSDVGGNFYTTRRNAGLSSRMMNHYIPLPIDKSLFISGQFLPVAYQAVTDTDLVWPANLNQANEELRIAALGTVAISRTIPTIPVVSLANFVGEFRNDGVPDLIGSILFRAKSRKDRASALPSEYLNYQFAVKPFVSDILKICRMVQKSDQLLDQFEQRSGKNFSRSYSFPDERTTTHSLTGNRVAYPALDTRAYDGPISAPVARVDSTTRETWFEAVYSYSLPLASDARSRIKLYAAEAEYLLGITPSIDVMWNLTPWSWFLDWFTNLGAIATNLSYLGKDNLVLRRGYIMGHTIVDSTYTYPNVALKGGINTGPLVQSFQSETKVRRKALRYGFGLTFKDFSPKQMAILSALGINLALDSKNVS